MTKAHVITHPFIADSLMHLRRKDTDLEKFRHHSDKICEFIIREATRNVRTQKISIDTPLESMIAEKLDDEVVIVPVLRAGLAMLFGALHFLPKSAVGFVGLERDEKTAIAREYYWKLPSITPKSLVIITDPMLATGGSALHVLRRILEEKPRAVLIACVIAAPEGIAAINQAFPEVEIYTTAIDDHLNDQKYIVPGLGDFGDRYFGTVQK